MSVHVFGRPGDDGEDRAVRADERLCTDADRDELVIYHCDCVLVTGSDNNWACRDCGEVSG